MVIMPQADSFTNALILTVSIPSFLLLSYVVDDTAEDEIIDEYGETILEYSHVVDFLCFRYEHLIQRIFSAISFIFKNLSGIYYFVKSFICFLKALFFRSRKVSYYPFGYSHLLRGSDNNLKFVL